MSNQEILDLEFFCKPLRKTLTVNDWIKAINYELFGQLHEFRGKYVFGTYNWYHDIIKLFVEKELLPGYFEYENGEEVECDYDIDMFKVLMKELIREL